MRVSYREAKVRQSLQRWDGKSIPINSKFEPVFRGKDWIVCCLKLFVFLRSGLWEWISECPVCVDVVRYLDSGRWRQPRTLFIAPWRQAHASVLLIHKAALSASNDFCTIEVCGRWLLLFNRRHTSSNDNRHSETSSHGGKDRYNKGFYIEITAVQTNTRTVNRARVEER